MTEIEKLNRRVNVMRSAILRTKDVNALNIAISTILHSNKDLIESAVLDQIEEPIPLGHPWDSERCPLANAFGYRVTGHDRWDSPAVCLFVNAFDRGIFPEYAVEGYFPVQGE